MRIAVVGSHATGKSTLVAELARRISEFDTVDEPFYDLLAAGHVFGDPPTIADFETFLEASVATLAAHRASPVVFDRSPADYRGYLVALQPGIALSDRAGQVASHLELAAS